MVPRLREGKSPLYSYEFDDDGIVCAVSSASVPEADSVLALFDFIPSAP